MLSRSTLRGCSKEQLIDHIERLEHNNAVLTDTIDQQYRNAMKLVEDMNVFNTQYEKTKDYRTHKAVVCK